MLVALLHTVEVKFDFVCVAVTGATLVLCVTKRSPMRAPHAWEIVYISTHKQQQGRRDNRWNDTSSLRVSSGVHATWNYKAVVILCTPFIYYKYHHMHTIVIARQQTSAFAVSGSVISSWTGSDVMCDIHELSKPWRSPSGLPRPCSDQHWRRPLQKLRRPRYQ